MSKAHIHQWLNSPIDPETKQEIQDLMKTNPHELEEAFSENLKFGTGGMRGLMGIGTSRMNLYTVQMATQGLANYLLTTSAQHQVFISYDNRHNSFEFAMETARVLAGNGIGVYLTSELRPTPYVSFGIREKKCSAGIMITASHNPKEYNGYKVYWSDGAQVVPPHDTRIVEEVQKVQSFDQIKLAPKNSSLIETVGPSFDPVYLDAIEKLRLRSKEDSLVGDRFTIIYTPLHGTGGKLVPSALRRWGFSNVHLVGAQIVPDGDFPTVSSPNPESEEALSMGIQQLIETQSDLLLATDPDADRIGVAVLHKGKPSILTGNQIACICLDYLCSTLKDRGKFPSNAAAVTTIVSTDLFGEIARYYGCASFEVLTGFKYIGELIHKWEEDKSHTFLFGAEESHGYLYGTHSRDKDAVISACLIAEIALLMQIEGRTLVDYLTDIYTRHGLFLEKQKVLSYPPGSEGMEKMKAIMETLRSNHVQAIGPYEVTQMEDYLGGYGGLPASNVLLFRLGQYGKIIVRPSGTEPKLKIYGCLRGRDPKATMADLETKLDDLLEATSNLF